MKMYHPEQVNTDSLGRTIAHVLLRICKGLAMITCMCILAVQVFIVFKTFHSSPHAGKTHTILERAFITISQIGHMILTILVFVSFLELTWFVRMCTILDIWAGRGFAMIYLSAVAITSLLSLKDISELVATSTSISAAIPDAGADAQTVVDFHPEKLEIACWVVSWFHLAIGGLFFLLGIFGTRRVFENERIVLHNPELALIENEVKPQSVPGSSPRQFLPDPDLKKRRKQRGMSAVGNNPTTSSNNANTNSALIMDSVASSYSSRDPTPPVFEEYADEYTQRPRGASKMYDDTDYDASSYKSMNSGRTYSD